MKVAVIGCGKIANSAHIPSYMANSETEIKYFCDIIPERAQEAVEKYGCGIAVTDYREVLADSEIEAVSICTHTNFHEEISVAALKAGKHVLCEKPAGRNIEEVRRMQEAQKKYGKVLNIGVVNRFNTNVNKMKEVIDSGALGEIYHVYVSFRSYRGIPGLGGDFTTKNVSGGGVLIDWGVHFLDIVMYCCGDPKALTVSSETFEKLGKNIEDYKFIDMWAGPPKKDGICNVEESVTGVVRTEGPVITFHGAWAQNINHREMYIDFMGTKGGIRLNYGAEFTLYSTDGDALTETSYQLKGVNMYQAEIDAFVDCIKTGKVLPSNVDRNAITAEMMDAIYKSAELHKEVVVGE